MIQRIDVGNPRHFPSWLPVYRVADRYFMVYNVFARAFWRDYFITGWRGRYWWAVRWHLTHIVVNLGKDVPA